MIIFIFSRPELISTHPTIRNGVRNCRKKEGSKKRIMLRKLFKFSIVLSIYHYFYSLRVFFTSVNADGLSLVSE